MACNNYNSHNMLCHNGYHNLDDNHNLAYNLPQVCYLGDSQDLDDNLDALACHRKINYLHDLALVKFYYQMVLA